METFLGEDDKTKKDTFGGIPPPFLPPAFANPQIDK
jgi:hypothetical protein